MLCTTRSAIRITPSAFFYKTVTNSKFMENKKAKVLESLRSADNASVVIMGYSQRWQYNCLRRTVKSSFMHTEIFTHRTAINRRHAAAMHEMVMAAIIPLPPTSSSETSSVVCPTGSTVLTWNHKNCFSFPIISYTVSHRLFQKQSIYSEFTTIN